MTTTGGDAFAPGMLNPYSNKAFENMSESEISILAKSLDDVSAGNNLAKIKDVLENAKASGESYVSAILKALSADNPKLPLPNPDLDPLQQNLDFQKWISENSVQLPGKDEAENYAYLMNAITAISTGQMAPETLVMNDTFEAKNLSETLVDVFGLGYQTNASGTAAVSAGPTEAFNELTPDEQTEIRDFISNLNSTPISGDETTAKSMGDVRSLIDGFSGTGKVNNLTDEESIAANLKFAETLVENAEFRASIEIAGSGQVADGPLPPLTKGYLFNAAAQLDDMSTGIQTLLDSIPADTKNGDQIEMKDFLKTVLTAIDNLRNLIREIANGNSAKAREASLAKMNDQIFSIDEQRRQQEKAEKAAKKQKTIGLVMKILGPILMVALVIATVLSGGLAGPLVAISVAMFAVAIADQIVSQASGQGMFSRMFDAMSKALPPGVALFLKCLTMVAVIAAAVLCPANGAIAMGLAFQIISSMGVQKDITSIAKDHGASDKTCSIISGVVTGCIAAAGIVATAGRGISQMRAQNLPGEVADNLGDLALRAKPNQANPSFINSGYGNVSGQGIVTTPKTLNFKDSIVNTFTGNVKEVGRAQDHTAINIQRASIGISTGSQGASGALGVVGFVGAVDRAKFERENAQIEALIIQLEAQMKALQKIVDTFLNGGSSLNEFADSCSEQINSIFKSLGSTMTDLARAANVKG